MYKIVYGNSPEQKPFNLRDQSDLQLAQLQLHENEWQVRHSRRILQERAVKKPIGSSARELLMETLSNHPSTPRRLRALWTLWSTEEIDSAQLLTLLKDKNEHVRHWAIRLEMERLKPFQPFVESMILRANNETSSMVRLIMASALQSLEIENRFHLAEKLVRFSEDAEDANIPLMLWYGIEPIVANNPANGLKLMQASQIPLLRQFIARRVSSPASAPTP